jgi:hypothetical protein
VRNNKQLLFGIMAFGGGASGALAAEVVPFLGRTPASLVGHTALWAAIWCAFTTVAICAAGEIYNRKPFKIEPYGKALVTGAIVGLIAGGIAQAVYSAQPGLGLFKVFVLRSLCWGLLGAIFGWRLAGATPNLGVSRGVTAGAIGGILGGILFLIVSLLIQEVVGRMIGVGILGGAVGLAIVTAEALFREASLDVLWSPKERTSFTLGPSPIYIGGGDDHVYVAGLAHHAAAVVHEQGKIQYIESATGQRTDLKDGSRIKIGPLEIVVVAKG